jgi:hypothetical protein
MGVVGRPARWCDEVADGLLGRLRSAEGRRIALLAERRRDIDPLRAHLPEAQYAPLSGVDALTTPLEAAVVWFALASPSSAVRRRLLVRLGDALRTDGTVLVVDHNTPRTWGRWLGNVGWCLRHGVEPIRRPAYPVARELQAAGFRDVSLRFAFGERLQIVGGVRSPRAETERR